MANMFRTSKKDKLEFKDIVLSHLKKILEITTQEFRYKRNSFWGFYFKGVCSRYKKMLYTSSRKFIRHFTSTI